MVKLPGLIDPHVHARGLDTDNYKEDFFTVTSAALAGGFTTILDMPNNPKRPTLTFDLLQQKQTIAKEKIVCDVGFFFGTDGQNREEFSKAEQGSMGLKVFLSQSTGGLLVTFQTFEAICNAWPPGKQIMLHVEGNDVAQAIEIAEKQTGHKVHICHVSSELELQHVMNAKEKGSSVTCGVCPQYLFLSEDDFSIQGAFAKMKPFLKPKQDQQFLWNHLQYIDLIESDHAPHSKEEKASDNPPFGVPGLETTLPLLLTAMHEKKLTTEDIQRLCHDGAARIFGITQDAQTYIEIDENEAWTIDQNKLLTKTKMSPFDGWNMKGKVKRVFIRGIKVFEDGKVLVEPGFGRILRSVV